jgi:hypothetical protein
VAFRWKCVMSIVLIAGASVVLWSAYAPERWLRRIRGLARVGLDEVPVRIIKPRPPKERIEGRTPKEIVDEVWRLATQGKLLTPEGWHVASGFFTEPTPFPANEKILIVSNDWGPANGWNSNETTAEVSLGYFDAGTIDAMLRYIPPPKTDFIKTGFAYSLVTVPAYMMMYGPDGKTLLEKSRLGRASGRSKVRKVRLSRP